MFTCVLIFFLCTVVVKYWRARDDKRRLLPPGPPADPLIGHARVLPRKNSEVVFTEWAKLYGDVVYLRVLGKSILILNSHQAATDLLDRRSAKYSSRPAFPVHDLVGWGDVLGITPYNDHFIRQRKLFHQALSRQECRVYETVQAAHVQTLLRNLLRYPDDFSAHVRHFTVAVIMEITYAHTVTSADDSYVQSIEKITDVIREMGNNQLLLFFSSLKYLPAWFPGASVIRLAKSAVPLQNMIRHEPFEEVRRQMSSGSAKPCFVSLQLEAFEREGCTEEDVYQLKVAATHMYSAAAETTWATISNFIAAMLLHPEVQAKAHAELDAAIGPGRLPEFSDRTALPYIESIMYEVMRWHPTAPLGVPHQTTADDMYRGMYIPKDTMVIANATAMSLDETVYKDPHIFRPERFLSPNAEPLPMEIFFGFGRRVCPGRHLAEAGVWLVLASILASFEVRPVKGENGRETMPEIEFSTGLTSHPKPFKCSFQPRSQAIRDTIQQL